MLALKTLAFSLLAVSYHTAILCGCADTDITMADGLFYTLSWYEDNFFVRERELLATARI